MKKTIFTALTLLLCSFTLYFGFGTKWTGKINQELDHYNSLAHSFLSGHLDIRGTPVTDELSLYQKKWYPYYGPFPALPIAFLQIISHKDFIPTLYPNAFVASVAVVMTYLLFCLLKRKLLPNSHFSPLIITLLTCFGTVFFWLATRSGIWFQVQIYAYLFSVLGLLPLISKKRTPFNYSLSIFFFSLNLLARSSVSLLVSIPLYLMFYDRSNLSIKKTFYSLLPSVLILIVFCLYNFSRFGHPLETGVTYQQFHYRLTHRKAMAGGWFSPINIPYNLWFMVLETPKLTLSNMLTPKQNISLATNPEGNSIFFFTPPLLALFLASPFKENDKHKRRFMTALWIGILLTLIPILLLTGTGWQQVGYRYTLDVTAPAMLLIILSIKGKPNLLFNLGTIFSVWIWSLAVITT